VQPIIEHGDGVERGCAIEPPVQRRRYTRRELIQDSRADRNRIGGLGDDWPMHHIQDHRRDVAAEDRVLRARSAIVSDARGPVLSFVVAQGRVDQFQRLAPAIGRLEPFPAQVPVVIQLLGLDAPGGW
jgi:hypothetical protein